MEQGALWEGAGKTVLADKQIAIIDTKATGPETVLVSRKACQLINEGCGFEEIVRRFGDIKTYVPSPMMKMHEHRHE